MSFWMRIDITFHILICRLCVKMHLSSCSILSKTSAAAAGLHREIQQLHERLKSQNQFSISRLEKYLYPDLNKSISLFHKERTNFHILAYFQNPFLFSYTWSGFGWVPSYPLAAGKASEWSGNLTPPPISPLLQTILSLQFPADSFKSFFLSPTFWILSALFLCKLFVILL